MFLPWLHLKAEAGELPQHHHIHAEAVQGEGKLKMSTVRNLTFPNQYRHLKTEKSYVKKHNSSENLSEKNYAFSFSFEQYSKGSFLAA